MANALSPEATLRRIRDNRTAEVSIRLTGGDVPAGTTLHVQMMKHDFLFGCYCGTLDIGDDGPLGGKRGETFAALFNYVTLPFYWKRYEPEPNRTREDEMDALVDRAIELGLTLKGHPLVWESSCPAWAVDMPEDEIARRSEARSRHLVEHFSGRIGIWDAINETTGINRFDNAHARWAASIGPVDYAYRAFQWAHETNPDAVLLYNDWKMTDETLDLIARLLDRGTPIGAIGLQSHMHRGVWTDEETWDVCERFGRFGLPLHFTETTILAGPVVPPRTPTPDPGAWPTSPEGEETQAALAARFYELVFSHPAVEAVTWWDFCDDHSWMGAPSGFLRADMSPRPWHERLTRLVHEEWATDETVEVDANGRCTVRCYFGEHSAEINLPSGQTLYRSFTAHKAGPREVQLAL